jgi:hypothetical protein
MENSFLQSASAGLQYCYKSVDKMEIDDTQGGEDASINLLSKDSIQLFISTGHADVI